MEKIQNGIWKFRFGDPTGHSCLSLLKYNPSPALQTGKDLPCPFRETDFSVTVSDRGVLLEYAPDADERFYGLGLMLKSFCHNGSKKHLRTNADPVKDTGDSHAPAPFLLSSAGYGIIVDSLRHVTFGVVNNSKKRDRSRENGESASVKLDTDSLYNNRNTAEKVLDIEIPSAKGVEIYLLAGETMLDVVRKYNLFFGGGCLPSLAGLGVLYRAYGDADEDHVLALAESLRNDGIPCDNFGLEPGWQSHAYSCTYTINREKFPHFETMLKKLKDMRFHVNIWEHAFINGQSPLYGQLFDYAGDYEVWQGLVPDFTIGKCAEIFAKHHQRFLDMGIESVKLDECDNSDYTYGWSFPDYARFPGGLDGEEMHAVFGHLYADVFETLFRKNDLRHFSQCRSNGLGASPYPFVIASDLYEHRDFLTGLVNCGFCGFLWSPEVRQTASEEELVRRLETAVFSPYCCVNMWMVKYEPWKQWEENKNREGVFLKNAEELTEKCRKILEKRMIFLPYLYTSFYRYKAEGQPPFRALVLDYPDDKNTETLSTEYMMGEDLLVAPFIADEKEKEREVYLPDGIWYDFYSEKKMTGGVYKIPRKGTEIPIFVKAGAILPLAAPRQYVPGEGEKFVITPVVYGADPRECLLYEDDTKSFGCERGEFNLIRISVSDGQTTVRKEGSYCGELYEIGEARIIE